MITLLSAAPGGGKTSYAVWHVIKKAIDEGRQVFTVGIPELTLPTVQVDYAFIRSWSEREGDDGAEKLINLPDGALIVVDEAWRVWPVSGTKVIPDHMRHLAMHRHYGLDFLVIAQMPSLVHKDVLAMVSKHVHIFPHWSGRKLLEWSEYVANPRTDSSRNSAITTRYQLPEQSFSLYKSASVHTKLKRKIPIGVFLTLLLFFAVPATGYFVYQKIFAPHIGGFVADAGQSDDIIVNIVNDELKEPLYVIENNKLVLESDVGKVINVTLLSDSIPWLDVSACLSNANSCICYGEMGNRLLIPLDQCLSAVKYGWPGSFKTLQSGSYSSGFPVENIERGSRGLAEGQT